MGENEIGFRYVVSGKVQGVFFRASAAREAVRLGVRGHALNLPDGRVEVLAIGTAVAVAGLRRWLGRGPPAARVDQVDETPVTPAAHGAVRGFTTG
jgi:acylphosphatase